MNKRLCQLCVVTVIMSLTSLASAHEMRHLCAGGNIVGKDCHGLPDTLMFHVGSVNEPAWATDSNGVNINISWHPDAAHDTGNTQNVDTSKGDTVVLDSVEVQYFGSERKYHPGMKPKQSTIIYSNQKPFVPQNLPDGNGNIAKKYGTNNVYNAYFRPSKAGVYGYVIKGEVDHLDAATNTKHHFEFHQGLSFICGAKGTQDTESTPPTMFGCVQDEIAIPSNGHD